MKTRILLLATIVTFTVACSSSKKATASKPEPTAVAVELTSELAQGKLLFENKCGRCHDLPSPSSYSKEKWTPIMEDMYKKAKMTEADRDLVYNYVTMGM